MAWNIRQLDDDTVRLEFDSDRYIEFGIGTDTDQCYIAFQNKAGTLSYIGTSSGAAVSAATAKASL